MKELQDQGAEKVFIRLLEDIYKDSAETTILYRLSEIFPTGKGVRKGDATFPKLFTACLESVFRKLDWEK